MKEENDIRELAIQYFEGKISRVDEQHLFAYIQQTEQHCANFRSWEQQWMTFGVSNAQTEREWKRLLCKMRTQEAILPMLISSRLSLWRKVAAIAAIVILTVGSTIGVWKAVDLFQADEYFVVEAPYGEKSKMVLSDGTMVWLNAGSKLKYSNKFNATNRRVELEGEAYFEVVKSLSNRFTVQTRGYDVVVKGTKFDISAYPDDSFIMTTLIEGAVELYYGTRQIPMSPGQSVSLNLLSGKFTHSKVNAIQSKAWLENRIEFDNITLKELIAKLSRQYDVNIHLESQKVGDKHYRISLRNRETIGEVLAALQEIVPIVIERKGKDIYIRE